MIAAKQVLNRLMRIVLLNDTKVYFHATKLLLYQNPGLGRGCEPAARLQRLPDDSLTASG